MMHHHREPRERMERSDEYLLELALLGDAGCFGELIRRWEQKIYGFIRRYVGNSDDARDLTQDTFVKAYQNLDRLSDPARFSSWLYKIALNECRMRFRREKRSRSVSLEEVNTEVNTITRDETTPESEFAAKEGVERLKEAFELLPREQREVIIMKEYQGLRFHEISDVLEIPLSTAKSRMYLGLKTLRRLMEGMV
jgi:RNA polymerase sigma-70 factor (ECF subfamily)